MKKQFDRPLNSKLLHQCDVVGINGDYLPNNREIDLGNTETSVRKLRFTDMMCDERYREITVSGWRAIGYREDCGKNSSTTHNRFNAFRHFIRFLDEYSVSVKEHLTLKDIDKILLESWGSFIQREHIIRNIVSHTKSLLLEMSELGFLERSVITQWYPSGTHRNANNKISPVRPYSRFVNRQVTQCLKQELDRIEQVSGEFTGRDIGICILAISHVCGADPSGLRYASVNCVHEHPFDPDKKVLLLEKRRGDSTQTVSAKYSEKEKLLSQIGSNVITIIESIKQHNHAVRQELPERDKDKLFASRASKGTTFGTAKVMSNQTMLSIGRTLVKKYNITDDDGKPVALTLQRLRATYLANIFELSGYNTALTAKYGQHSLSVANQHYRVPTNESRYQFLFAVENIVQELSSGVATSAASCSDIINGERNILKNKQLPCMEILGCFRCRNMVVTKMDLNKLLSLKWAIIRERDIWANGNKKQWKKRFRDVLKVIDEIILTYKQKYPVESSYVDNLIFTTRTEPHPFWRDLSLLRQQIALMNQMRHEVVTLAEVGNDALA